MLCCNQREKASLLDQTTTYGTEDVKLSINDPLPGSAPTLLCRPPPFLKSPVFHHLMVNGIILAIFIGLYKASTNESLFHHIPYIFTSGFFYLLAFVAIKSSIAILFFCASRGTEFLLPVVFFKSVEWLPQILMIQGALEYVLNVYAVSQVPIEYILSWKTASRRRSRSEVDFYEKIESKARIFMGSCAAMMLLGIYSIKFSGLWIPVGSKISQMISIVSGFMIVFFAIFRVQTETRKGFELHSPVHSNGLVLALLLGGMVIRLAIDSIQLLIGIPLEEYLPNVGLDGYQGSAKELLTMGVPLAVHLLNINSKTSNIGKRARGAFYLALVIFGALVDGYVVTTFSHECDLAELGKKCVKPFTVFLARVGALMGTLFINLTILCILTPISQLIYSFLNLGVLHHAVEKLHFHRDMAYNAIFFFLLHVCAHAYTWITIPSISYNNVLLYSVTNTSFVTGIVMLSGFLVATFSGIFPAFFRFHIVAVLAACMAFMFHGYQHILGPALGDYATLTVIIIVVILVCFFSFTTPVLHLEVVQEECRVTGEREGKRLLLVLKYESTNSIAPGSYYNIYNSNASWQLFHGHPFTAFSTRTDRLCFLIAVRNDNSFTDRLCKKVMTLPPPSASISVLSMSGRRFKPVLLHLRGPFLSPATALVEYIEQNRTSYVDLFICGGGTGITSVSSLADLFSSKQARFPRLSVKVVCDINTCGWMQEGKEEREKGRNSHFLSKFNEMSGLALSLNSVRRRRGKEREEKKKKIAYTQSNGQILFYHLVDEAEPVINAPPDAINEGIPDTPVADSIDAALALAEKQDKESSRRTKVLFYCGRNVDFNESFSSWIVFTETSD